MLRILVEIGVLELLAVDVGLVERGFEARVGHCIVHVVQVAGVLGLGEAADGPDGEVVRSELSRVEDPLQVAHFGAELDGALTQLVEFTAAGDLVLVWVGCRVRCEVACLISEFGID